MADALSALLNLDSPTNANRVAASYTPNISRNNARAAMLSRFLGIPDSGDVSQSDMEDVYQQAQAERDADEAKKAAAALAQARLKGEYELAGETIKGRSAIEQARYNRDAAALEHAAGREFTGAQNELNRTQRSADARYNQEQMTGRTQMAQQGLGQRQAAGQAEARAKLLEAGKVKAGRPAGETWVQWLFGPSQSTLNQQEAARLRSSALSGLAIPAASTGDQSDEDLTARILARYPDATPDEIQQWIAQSRGGQ